MTGVSGPRRGNERGISACQESSCRRFALNAPGGEAMPKVKAPATGVGQTAMFTAWVRHLESHRPDALFHDPFATVMLSAMDGDPALADVASVIEQSHVSA